MKSLSRGTGSRGGDGAASAASKGENLLIISDIHLGEDDPAQGCGPVVENLRLAYRELCDFVAYHSVTRHEGRRWHLVVNGDMFDFLKVCVHQDCEDVLQRRLRERRDFAVERMRENIPEHVVWKLERILAAHRALLQKLAFFLRSGHRLTVVFGNHDDDFLLPEVQQTLRSHLVDLALQVEHGGGEVLDLDATELGESIRFKSWFEASPGRYHIEHGHQYDALGSFEYRLAPEGSPEAPALTAPASQRPLPYLAELLGDLASRGSGYRAWLALLRRSWRLGLRGCGRVIRTYLFLGFKVLSFAARRQRALSRSLEKKWQEQMRVVGPGMSYDGEILRGLSALRVRPAEFSWLKMLHLFRIDRLFVGLIVLGGVAGAFWLRGPVQAGVLALSLFVGAVSVHVLGRIGRPRVVEALRAAATKIAETTGVRYVVFGHGHQPEFADLTVRSGLRQYGEHAFYFNCGPWVSREVLHGAAGTGMTFVEINQRGAHLKQWLGHGTDSVVMARADADASA